MPTPEKTTAELAEITAQRYGIKKLGKKQFEFDESHFMNFSSIDDFNNYIRIFIDILSKQQYGGNYPRFKEETSLHILRDEIETKNSEKSIHCNVFMADFYKAEIKLKQIVSCYGVFANFECVNFCFFRQVASKRWQWVKKNEDIVKAAIDKYISHDLEECRKMKKRLLNQKNYQKRKASKKEDTKEDA